MKIDSARIETFLALCILLTTAVLFGKYYQPASETPTVPVTIVAPEAESAK